jgi:putative transposase
LSKTGKFYAFILVDDGVATPSPIHTVGKVVGIDLGLSHYAIGSNGGKTANMMKNRKLAKHQAVPHGTAWF